MSSKVIGLLEGRWVARYIPKNEEIDQMGFEEVADDEFDKVVENIEEFIASNYPDDTLSEEGDDGLTPLKTVDIRVQDGGWP